ncbi:hypothetical protein [uncultured Salinibacterium sp.]|tara:strand:- start:2711 stop:2845 length:135 start_codon:yes stop_codon:yes gene_type:complete
MDTLVNSCPDPVSPQQENLQKPIGTFEREIHAAAIKVFKTMTGN